MESHIPLTLSFHDYVPQCVHGIKLDKVCEECQKRKEEDAKFYNESAEWVRAEMDGENKSKEESKIKHQNNPELFMNFIPLKFRTKSFDNFNGSDQVKKILKEYSDGFINNIKYIAGKPVLNDGLVQYPGSILLTGKTGCGKTHLAVSIVTELVKRSFSIDCIFVTAPEILLEIRSTFNTTRNTNYDKWINGEPGHTCETEEEVLDKYSNCGLLILDDLGAEKVSDFTIQSLYLIIDRRNRNLKPTIVTTNLTLEEIETLIDARMASRLSDMKVIKLNMPDYRKKR